MIINGKSLDGLGKMERMNTVFSHLATFGLVEFKAQHLSNNLILGLGSNTNRLCFCVSHASSTSGTTAIDQEEEQYTFPISSLKNNQPSLGMLMRLKRIECYSWNRCKYVVHVKKRVLHSPFCITMLQ
ncbi:hypothetical protein L1887_04605 [Cichorium endivia]|nr:hypothetical protein L1887_04605 [Cichorium endivia]